MWSRCSSAAAAAGAAHGLLQQSGKQQVLTHWFIQRWDSIQIILADARVPQLHFSFPETLFGDIFASPKSSCCHFDKQRKRGAWKEGGSHTGPIMLIGCHWSSNSHLCSKFGYFEHMQCSLGCNAMWPCRCPWCWNLVRHMLLFKAISKPQKDETKFYTIIQFCITLLE